LPPLNDTMIRSASALGLACLLLLVGCGPAAPKLYPVSGTVTLDGQPLADGKIYFRTVENGQVDTLPVTAGKFSGQVLAGPRRVEIVAYKMIQINQKKK